MKTRLAVLAASVLAARIFYVRLPSGSQLNLARTSAGWAKVLVRWWVALALAFVWPAVACPVAEATFPGKNGRIAYGTRHDTLRDDDPSRYWIRTVLPDGSAARRIAPHGSADPAFSPRGARIAYASYDVTGGHGLYTEHVDGSRRRRRLTGMRGDGEPAWSPSGRRLVFTRDDDTGFRNLWIHDARENRFLTRGSGPDWSVKGDIVFSGATTGDNGIWVIRPDGSALRRLTAHGYSPAWSPSGRTIVLVTGCCPSHIATMHADGADFHRLTWGPASDSAPAFSPDGRRIAFIRDPANAEVLNPGRLMTMSPTGRHLTVIAAGGGWGSGGLDWQPRPAAP